MIITKILNFIIKIINCINKNELYRNILLLIIGAAISYIIIPLILEDSNKKKLVFEKRIIKSREIINHNRDLNQNLNLLQTALELFHKDNRSMIGHEVDYLSSQKEMRKEINRLYLEFEKVAWYWYWTIYEEAKIIEQISEERLNKLNAFLTLYDKNVVKSTEVLSKFWNLCLRETYDPHNKNIDKSMTETRKKLNELSLSRDIIIRKIIRVYLQKIF